MLKIRLEKETTFEYPVAVYWPERTGHVKKGFIGTFKLLSQPDADALIEKVQKHNREMIKLEKEREKSDLAQEDETALPKMQDVVREACEEVLQGWGNELRDEDSGEPIPFNAHTKAAVLNNPILKKAVWNAYTESIGGEKARRGN